MRDPSPERKATVLEVHSVSCSFGGVFAVKDVSLRVPDGELRGVIGPNGAGKSTLFSLIGGHQAPGSGSLEFDGVHINPLPVHRRARLGIAIVFQGARVFPGMTVAENVMVGATATTGAGAVAAALRTRRMRREERQIEKAAAVALERVGLGGWADRDVESLPLGQQRRLQVARALACSPKLLLLDEPASGLRAGERAEFAELVAELHSDGMSIMLIEHDVHMVTELADRITVLDLGEVIAEGTPDEIQRDPRVIEAYLGTEASHADRS